MNGEWLLKRRRKGEHLLIWIFLLLALFSTLSVCPAQNSEFDALNRRLVELYQAGQFQQAIPIAEQVLAHNEKALGLESPDTAKSLNDLAELYRQTHDYAKAEPLFRRALRIREKVLGPDHHHTAYSLYKFAKLYEDMGDYVKAAPLFQRLLTIYERVLGLDDPETASVLNYLALSYNKTGEYAKAEPLYQRALTIREKVLGPEHPHVAISLQNLAALYQDMGVFAKAEPLLQRALRINEKVSGPEHPNTAANLNNLAELYRKTGEYAKAAPLFQRALRIRETMLGPEHPDTAVSLNNMALMYKLMGDYAKAEPLLRRALTIHEKVRGSEHPDTATVLGGLATLYELVGDYAKAEPLYQRALNIREKVLGPEHPDTATGLNNLVVLYEEMGDYTKAEPLAQRALRIREKVLGPEHPATANSLSNMAVVYKLTDDYAKAEPLYQRALNIREKVLGPEHPDTGTSVNNLASLYSKTGQYAKAEPLYQQSLKIAEKALGPEHPHTAASLDNLAFLKLDVTDVSGARILARRSDKVSLKIFSNVLSFCSEPQRLAYQGTVAPYTLFAAIEGSDSELAATCLRYKGVVLDSIIEDRVLAEASQNKEDREMVQTLAANKQRLGQMLLEGPNVSADHTAEQIQQLEQAVEQIEGKMARHVVGLGRARRALSVKVEEVQAAIPTDAALIEYVRYPHYLGKSKFESRYGAVVLAGKGKPQWIPIGKANEIENSVRRYQSQVTDRDTAEPIIEETLRRLFQQVWAPIARALAEKTKTVIISPDGQLNFISFATLVTPKDRFLAQDYGLQYVSSGRDLLREVEDSDNSRLIAFGNPDFSLKADPVEKGEPPIGQQIALRGKTREALEELELPALPGTKAECAMLAERSSQWKWRSTRFQAAEATETELRQVKSPYILHLATHGFFLNAQKEDRLEPKLNSPFEAKKSRYFENPMHRAGLALAGAQATLEAWQRGETPPTDNDGIVTAEEVSDLKLEGTWLVTLSACNTGSGEAKSGEGVLGLRRGFIQAGTKNLLMTVWPINDETTVDIMSDFYEAAHKSGNAPKGLAEVQRDWLVKLRKSQGLLKAVNIAGPFIMSSQGRP